MEINKYPHSSNKTHQNTIQKKAASEYEASQVKSQQIKPYGQDQRDLHLSKGDHTVIRGEIIDLRFQEVKIRLEPSNQVITARLSGEVSLSIGQIAEFIVSDEIDGLITLKYISSGNTQLNDILYKALYASGLTPSDRNLSIVQELLNYQMPVDKNTILNLIKLTSTYPDVNLTTLVLMYKNKLPINISNIAQFEAYQKGMHQVLSQLKQLTDNIGDALISHVQDSTISDTNIDPDTINVNQELITKMEFQNTDIERINDFDNELLHTYKELMTLLTQDEDTQRPITPDMVLKDILPVLSDEEIKILRDWQLTDSSITIKELLTLIHDIYINDSKLQNTEINMLPFSIFEAFISISEDLAEYDFNKLISLLKSNVGREVITDAFHKRWTLEPDELTKKNKVREFFKRLDKDTEHLKRLSDDIKLLDTQDVRATINKLQDNLQFMRDLNELFIYLQLPMRLAEQDAHGDLYVFTRKNHKHQDSETLNVLLHLDMANLGPMDIHMYMKNHQVNAVFYLEKSSEYIIAQHLHELVDSLHEKGYQLQAKTKISDSKPDFIADILQQNTPNITTHRYSFDIRA
ncbi:MAG: flagellar hook-length control protein FliK [Clostridiales bacterium]|jgi:hypothetical protein|nr:flagellar hook-length control protein FliK [Clostridiales bacterium]